MLYHFYDRKISTKVRIPGITQYWVTSSTESYMQRQTTIKKVGRDLRKVRSIRFSITQMNTVSRRVRPCQVLRTVWDEGDTH